MNQKKPYVWKYFTLFYISKITLFSNDMLSVKFLVIPVLLILLSSGVLPYSFATVESEAQEDISAGCRDNQTLVYRQTYGDYVCVDPSTADRWEELGMAEIIQKNTRDTVDVTSDTETQNTSEFYGAPPPPPPKSDKPLSDDSQCRAGHILVYRLLHHDTFCTSTSTATTWERLGLAEIIRTDRIIDSEVANFKDEVDDSLKELEIIPKLNNNEEEAINNDEKEDENNNEEKEDTNDESTISIFLEKLTLLYSPKIYQIGDQIWAAVGYGPTNSVLIEGDRGIIVIDTLNSYESSKKVLEDFKTISDKPVKTIVYTTLNPNLVSGTQAFLEEGDGDVEIIASEDLLESYIDQYDSTEYDLDNYGFAPQVTHTFSSEFTLDISGVKMNLVFIEGDHSDQIYIFLPDDDAVLIGDSDFGVSPFVLEPAYFQNLLD